MNVLLLYVEERTVILSRDGKVCKSSVEFSGNLQNVMAFRDGYVLLVAYDAGVSIVHSLTSSKHKKPSSR